MSEVTLFENPQFGSVRVIMRGNDPWFVAKDVCNCLALSDVSMSLRSLDDDEKGTNSICTLGGNQDMSIISESGFYSLVLRSRKPEAKAFKRWVTHEVLPSIRKTGMYMPNFNDPLEAAKAWVKAEEEKRKAQLEAKAARVALSQKSAALAELLNDWGEGETFHSVIAESKRICKYFNVKYAIDPGDTVYKQLGQLMVKLCNGGYSSSGKSLIKDDRFVGHKFPWEYKSHPSSTFGGWNVYHIDAWAYLYEIIERDGAASLLHVGKYAK